MMRLDRCLAERTGLTRSESRKAIAKGRVAVEGAVCRKADTQVPEDAAILLDGAPLAGTYRKFVHLMLNKPAGVVSASRDKRDTTVVDLAAAAYPRRALFPAGCRFVKHLVQREIQRKQQVFLSDRARQEGA